MHSKFWSQRGTRIFSGRLPTVRKSPSTPGAQWPAPLFNVVMRHLRDTTLFFRLSPAAGPQMLVVMAVNFTFQGQRLDVHLVASISSLLNSAHVPTCFGATTYWPTMGFPSLLINMNLHLSFNVVLIFSMGLRLLCQTTPQIYSTLSLPTPAFFSARKTRNIYSWVHLIFHSEQHLCISKKKLWY